jgi:hypothetical protein
MHSIAAKALALTTMTTTAMLRLFAPTSLTATASEHAPLASPIAWMMLALVVIGWVDIIVHDLLGRDLLPRLSVKTRHKGCVLFYMTLASTYWIFAFAALKAPVSPGAILIGNYLACGLWILVLAAAIAQEDRSPQQRGAPP